MVSETREQLIKAVDEMAERLDFDRITAEYDEEAAFPWPIWNALSELGVPSLEFAPEVGGLGLPLEDVVAVTQRLGYHSIAASTGYFTFTGFGAHVISGLEEGHPLRSMLPAIAAGQVRTALALTEPGGGSDLSIMRTRMSRRRDQWVLHGSKMFTTLAAEATHLVVAALDSGGKGSWYSRVCFAVLDKDTPGVTIGRVRTQALRTCPTYEVSFDGVEVPVDRVIEPGMAFRLLTSTLNLERLAVAAQSCGLGQRALEDAISYTRTRERSQGVLLDLQVVRHQLVEVWQSLKAAEAMLAQAVKRVGAGETSGVLPTMTQRLAAQAAHAVADLNVQLHGGSGLATEGMAQRLWRDTRLHLIGPIAQAVSADYLAQQLLREIPGGRGSGA